MGSGKGAWGGEGPLVGALWSSPSGFYHVGLDCWRVCPAPLKLTEPWEAMNVP